MTDPAASENKKRWLIERCVAGDHDAWEDFYGTYRDLIARTVRRVYGGGHEDPEDIIQEVFIQLFKSLKTYDPSRPLEVFIVEIARRVRIGRYRRASAVKRGGGNPGPSAVDPSDCAEGSDSDWAGHAPSSQEEELARFQERRLLHRAVRALTEPCRQLLGMRYEEGLSYREIAERLKVREGTLRVRAQRCLASLSRAYEASVRREAS